MATEISLDLINRLKVSLRNEAKLDHTDSYTLALPKAPEAIAELDASAPYLRCRSCKGKLLRGIDSLICVFCGKQQPTSENPPDPIKFTSTSAYKWLLSSLDLDGSEMVEPLKEANGSRRIGAKAVPVTKGVAVCEFLDFEVQWCVAREEKTSSNNGVDDKRRLDLGGISLDDCFVEGRREEDDFKDPRSLSLFDSGKSQGVAAESETVGLFNGKDAQKNENLSLFAGRDEHDSSVSVSEQGNFGFFEEKEDGNLSLFEGIDDQRTSSCKNTESVGFFEGEDAQNNTSSKEDESFGLFEGKDADAERSSSGLKEDEDFGLFEGALSSNAGLNKVVASSSDWNSDFHMDSVFGSGKDLFHEKTADSSTAYVSKAGDWLLQDDWLGDVTVKTQNNVHEGQVVGGNESSSMDIDWMGDDLWQTSEKKAVEKTYTDDNDGKDQTLDHGGTTCRMSKSDVAEELMSQMHDLSFMLETNLSVPPISKAE